MKLDPDNEATLQDLLDVMRTARTELAKAVWGRRKRLKTDELIAANVSHGAAEAAQMRKSK